MTHRRLDDHSITNLSEVERRDHAVLPWLVVALLAVGATSAVASIAFG